MKYSIFNYFLQAGKSGLLQDLRKSDYCFSQVSIVLTKIFKEIMNWEARHLVSYG